MHFYNCFQLNSFSWTKQWILGEKCENPWFSLFFVWTNKNPKCWCKMIVRTMVEICAKFLISRLKIGGAITISLVAIATATFISWHSFWAHWGKNFVLHIFSGSLVDSFCSLCLFSEKLGEKFNIETMTSLCWWRHEIYDVTAWECHLFTLCRFEDCFIANYKCWFVFYIKLSRIKVLSKQKPMFCDVITTWSAPLCCTLRIIVQV